MWYRVTSPEGEAGKAQWLAQTQILLDVVHRTYLKSRYLTVKS